MRFLRLEVSHFRAVDHAVVDFGAGLNVLFGPNDLGKTTLAAALRAVLLLPAESSAHQQFLPWHSTELPQVCLSFKTAGQQWRITKTFGSSAATATVLESSLEAATDHQGTSAALFREEARGRAADRRVRELLRWGIEAPGGKGGGRGLPESFLSHVLLGAQGSVTEILGRTLGMDRDASGRQQLHEMLQALAQDPVFQRVLQAAQEKADSAFTPTGRRKAGQSSPFAPIRQNILELSQELDRVAHQKRESDEVSRRIQLASDRRLALEAEIESASIRVAEQEQLLTLVAAQASVRERAETARRELEVQRAAEQELGRLRAELEAARKAAERSAQNAAEQRRVNAEAQAELATAEARLRELGSAESRQRDQAALDELERQRRDLEVRTGQLRRREERERALERANAALAREHAAEGSALQRERELREGLEVLERQLQRLEQLEAAGHLRDASAQVERTQQARRDGDELSARAVALAQRANSLESASGALAELAPRVLGDLRALEAELRVARAKLDVGLSVTLELPAEQSAEVAIDGSAPRVQSGAESPLVVAAKSRVSMRVGRDITFLARAGDPALRRELEALEARWREQALPLFGVLGVESVDALAEAIEAARARRRDAQDARREAESLEARALEKREIGAALSVLQERVEQRRRELEGSELAALAAELEPLGPGWQGALGRRRNAAQNEQRRLSLERLAGATALASAGARVEAATQALSSARAERDQAQRDLGEALSSAEVLQQLREAENALALLVTRAEERLRELSARVSAAERSRQQAAEKLGRASAGLEATLTAERQARERLLALEAQLLERGRHLDPARLRDAEIAAERARSEVAVLPALPEIREADLARSRAELDTARAQLVEVLAELRRAEGALGQVGGDVIDQRERQTREALERARGLEVELEREYDAYKLLTETLRGVENEQGAHLGRALEGPVSERFRRLTEGRYGRIGLDPLLGFEGVSIAGQARAYQELSEGTQEQLATILRLCIAEQLGTALVLDDHLAQTHRERAAWFRAALRQSAERIQIVLLTARPEDYVSAEELRGDALVHSVSVVDLGARIRRASYASA